MDTICRLFLDSSSVLRVGGEDTWVIQLTDMGLSITLYRVIEEQIPYPKVKREEWFESERYVGDRDFAMNVDFTEAYSEDYNRPSDFALARKYVVDNIVKANQPRLLELLSKMQQDDKLVLSFSW